MHFDIVPQDQLRNPQHDLAEMTSFLHECECIIDLFKWKSSVDDGMNALLLHEVYH